MTSAQDNVARARALTAEGYRRVSNKYGIVARINREDWDLELKKHLGRDDLPGPLAQWKDFYRRSEQLADWKEVGPAIARHVPNSNWDEVGYVELEDR